MKKSEVKTLLLNSLEPFFASHGYKKVKAKLTGFVSLAELGNDRFHFDVYDYNPIQNIHYYCLKKINLIDNLYEELHKRFVIHPALSEISSTLCFSYETINSLNSIGYLPNIREEVDVQANTDLIIEFMKSTALPMLERFNDIREIDKEINGDAFWEDDWRKPFNLGGGFAFKRLIIAYLCGNNNFDKLYDYNNGLFDYSNKEFPVQIIDGKNSIEYLKEILEKSKKWNSV
jgi:hypothetical protein